MFWRDPDFLTSLMHMLSPQLEGEPERRKPDAGQRRAEEALSGAPQHKDRPQRDEIERQAILTWSGREVLRRKDFDQMSASELAEAERAVRVLDLPVKPILTRRTRPDRYGARPDPRATLRAARRRAGEIERIERKTARVRHPRSRGAVRHLGVHVGLFADASALHARRDPRALIAAGAMCTPSPSGQVSRT